jgi:hypothetical protein
MRDRFTTRSTFFFTLAAIVAGGLAGAASPARADIADVFRNAKAQPVATPHQLLPALSDPRPYRQLVIVTCNVNNPLLGNNACIMIFDQVASGRLLQIDNINCAGGDSSGVIIFNTQVKIDHFAGLALAPAGGSGVGVASGPYYFKAAETPKLGVSNSGAPDATAACSIFGLLWQAN